MSVLSGRGGRHARVAIFCPTPEEFQALLLQGDFRTFVPDQSFRFRNELETGVYDIVAARTTDQTNGPCMDLVRDLVEFLRPEFIILCGIAGGIEGKWGAQLGNVIVADHVEGYEGQRRIEGAVIKKKVAYDHPSYFLRQKILERVRYRTDWIDAIKVPRPDARDATPGKTILLDGNIISGDKLLGDGQNAYQREILEAYPNAVAVDMESFGLARAVYAARQERHYNLQYLIVRSISDPVVSDDKEEKNQETRDNWRPYAAAAAASFAITLAEEILTVVKRD